MSLPLFSTPLRQEHDIVFARQRTRQIAQLMGFDGVEQTRIATAVSELARNAFTYAGGGKIEFQLQNKTAPQAFLIKVIDSGQGIANLQDILDGRYKSATGMGLGIVGSRRILDAFDVQTSPQGTTITLIKNLPRHINLTTADIGKITTELFHEKQVAPIGELQQQNRELLETLQELERRKEKLQLLNLELEETNRGVVALYAELDERAEQLRRADEVKTRFLSYMSHEFRTPVTSTLSLTRFLLDRTDGELTAEQEKQVSLIRKSMEGLLQLVNDLLDLAKVEAGRIDIHPETCTVEEIFSSLRGMFRPLITNPNIVLNFDIQNDIPPMETDEGKLSQILRNFISNAIKFTEKGQINVTASYQPEGRTVIFAVSDTGIGIAPADQDSIFQEFNQVFHSLQKKSKGTGLGLPLSKKLAELLGGFIRLESVPGQGSTFIVSMPLHCAASGKANEEAFSAFPVLNSEAAIDDADGFKVLIIDDEEASYYALKRALKESGHTVIELSQPEIAVDFAKNDKPSLIILDLMMPNIPGHIVLDALKNDEDTRDIPVVIHSGSILTDDERKILLRQSIDILPKDISPLDAKVFVKNLGLNLKAGALVR